jgi:choline dehydrogenase-like flavoprotein
MGTVKAYDYIIIGHGTAGATLARKLSDMKNGRFANNVLVLEWGINRTADPIVENPNPLAPTSGVQIFRHRAP